MEKLKENNGITLIALITTIVVLLTLAGAIYHIKARVRKLIVKYNDDTLFMILFQSKTENEHLVCMTK